MFVICDNKDAVQDIATEKANLSRGLLFTGHKLHENVKAEDILIGDTYKDGKLTRNPQTRIDLQQQQADEAKIQAKIRELAVGELVSAGELPAGYE